MKWHEHTWTKMIFAHFFLGQIQKGKKMLLFHSKKMKKSTHLFRFIIDLYTKQQNNREACRMSMHMMHCNQRLSRLDWIHALENAIALKDWNLYWAFRDWMKIRARNLLDIPSHLMLEEATRPLNYQQKTLSQQLNDKTKIIRKPEGKGTELKAIADGDTGILLALDIVEGKERQRMKRFSREYGEGTAIVLRFAEPYKGTGRTIVADSAFASVKTLVQLENLCGLYFMGMVKTATHQFPKRYLEEWYNSGQSRGSFKILRGENVNGKLFYALCWSDKKPKTIISNRGTTIPGNPSIIKRM
jgi:hypothetical protein